MTAIKKYAWPTLIILIVSLFVALLILPLANTEFADDIRIYSMADDDDDKFGEGAEFGTIPWVIYVMAGFLKVFFKMGVAGFIAYRILRIVRRFSRKGKVKVMPGT